MPLHKFALSLLIYMHMKALGRFKRLSNLFVAQLSVMLIILLGAQSSAFSQNNILVFQSDFGLKDQFRRAVMSISYNVAEGFEYNNNPDFIRFLTCAKRSSGETRNNLSILQESKKLCSNDYNFLFKKCLEFSAKTKKIIDYLRAFEQQKKLKPIK